MSRNRGANISTTRNDEFASKTLPQMKDFFWKHGLNLKKDSGSPTKADYIEFYAENLDMFSNKPPMIKEITLNNKSYTKAKLQTAIKNKQVTNATLKAYFKANDIPFDAKATIADNVARAFYPIPEDVTVSIEDILDVLQKSPSKTSRSSRSKARTSKTNSDTERFTEKEEQSESESEDEIGAEFLKDLEESKKYNVFNQPTPKLTTQQDFKIPDIPLLAKFENLASNKIITLVTEFVLQNEEVRSKLPADLLKLAQTLKEYQSLSVEKQYEQLGKYTELLKSL